MMRRQIVALSCLAATLAAAAATPAGASRAAYAEADLKARIAGEMALAGPAAGAVVRDMQTGEELYALRADGERIPASVQKLYTTAAALLRLGPAATIATAAVTSGAAAIDPGGVLRGDLVLVGGGDPFFGDVTALRLARAVRAAGITRIAGAVVGDESRFDRRRSGCCAGYDFDLGGVLSALAYDRGIFHGRARLDAGRFAAGRFAALLRQAGVPSIKPSRAGTAPLGALPIARVASTDVATLARLINVPSNNFAAEMLLKVLGVRYGTGGTLPAGAAVVRATLGRFGVTPRIVDGSGLSRANRTSPRQVVALLGRMDDPDVALAFRASLATAGVTGTVRRRMRGTPAQRRCRVKTGTLRAVSTLAGYCRAVGGRDIGFALLMNRVDIGGAQAIQDRIAAAIALLGSDGRAPQPVPSSRHQPAPPAGPESGGAMAPETATPRAPAARPRRAR